MSDKTCVLCQHWRKGRREKNGVWDDTESTGVCTIRSTPGHFPVRYADDYCHEYKRIEVKHPGYMQVRAGIAE